MISEYQYCEQYQSETAVYFQSVYYNGTFSSNQQSSYMKSQQVRTEWGVAGEGEREKESSGLTE